MHAFLQARYLASAAKPAELPPQVGPEIAFAGRSNVGKSSAINALAGRRRLAFTSRTPGRTRTINFFELGGGARLADLPGYGFASAPKLLRSGWEELIGGYLRERGSLAGVALLIDARHPLAANDRNFLEWLRPVATRRLVLLSKADKLSRAERERALAQTRRGLEALGIDADCLLFARDDASLVAAARARLEAWLGDDRAKPLAAVRK